MIKKRDLDYNLTVEEAWLLFDEDKRAEGINTSGNYYELTRFLEINDLTMKDYVSVIGEQMYNKYMIHLRERGLAIASINHYLSAFRTFLNWCFNHGYVSPFKIKMIKGQEEQIKFASDEEVAALLQSVNHNDYVEMRTYTIICFILSTGARSSTIRNIHINDVDFKNHTVTYRHLKNKKIATIPLTSQIERILHGFIKTWDTQSDFLFPDIKGSQLTPNALKLSFARYCKERGLRAIYPHSLRHTFARSFIKNGGNSMILKEFLCHNSLEMTKRYVRLFSNDILESGFENYIPLNNFNQNKSRTRTVTKNVWIKNYFLDGLLYCWPIRYRCY